MEREEVTRLKTLQGRDFFGEEPRTNKKQEIEMRKLSTIASVAMIAAVSLADLIVPANTADTYSANGGVTLRPVTDTTLRIGQGATADSADYYQMAVIPFLLPDLPAGERIDTASLSIEVTQNAYANLSSGQNLNIIGVRSATSSTVLAADFSGGTTVASSVLYMDYDVPGIVADHTFSSAGLADYLQSIYDAPGYVSGSTYVFLRLAPNEPDVRANSYLIIASANHTTASVPTLTLTTIPEPATVGMLGFGTLMILMIRRIRTK